jgi:Fic family protein
VLNSLYLTQENLLTLPILYLSCYIINNKADYYHFLLGVTRYRDWEYWLYYLIQGVEETALWTTAKIAAIRALYNMTIDHVKKPRLKFIAESWWI